MSTRMEGNEPARTAAAPRQTADGGPTPGIVRSATLLWAAAGAGGVALAHAMSTPHAAWLPSVAHPLDAADLLHEPMSLLTAWVVSAQFAIAPALAGLPWPTRLFSVALANAAGATLLLALAIRRTGLPAPAAALLAGVAALGPLWWAQSVTPLGGATTTLIGAVLVWTATRSDALTTGRPPGRLVALAAAGVVVVSLAASGSLRTELGAPGVLLALVGAVGLASTGSAAGIRTALILAVALVLGWLAGPPIEVSAAAPAAWWLSGAGIVRIGQWRGRHTRAWLHAGLAAWIALHAYARPWAARADATVTLQAWLDAMASHAGPGTSVAIDATPLGVMLDAHLRSASADARVSPSQAYATLQEGPDVVLLPSVARHGRWMGYQPGTAAPRTSLARVIDSLPVDVLVVAGVSADASGQMRAADWQALALIGGRAPQSAAGRARAVVGLTGTRASGTEQTAIDQVRLGVLVGDLVGQTGVPSPVDLTVTVDERTARLSERGRLRDADGVVLAVYRRSGALLALWTGATPESLSSAPLGDDVRRAVTMVAALPCIDLSPGQEADVTPLAISGAVGLNVTAAATIEATSLWPDDHPAPAPSIVLNDDADDAPALPWTIDGPRLVGIDVHGRPGALSMRVDAPARACAAPPLAPTVTGDHLEVPVHPRAVAWFGAGWHDMEPMGGGAFFRWTSGPASTLLFTLPEPRALHLILDAQPVAAPRPGDRLTLRANGTVIEAVPLVVGRSLHRWTLPAHVMRHGLNELQIESTLVVRPADVGEGADTRQLGLAVYGWRVGTEAAE